MGGSRRFWLVRLPRFYAKQNIMIMYDFIRNMSKRLDDFDYSFYILFGSIIDFVNFTRVIVLEGEGVGNLWMKEVLTFM